MNLNIYPAHHILLLSQTYSTINKHEQRNIRNTARNNAILTELTQLMW